MRLLFDENLAEGLLPAILPTFPESSHVRLLGAGGATDESIWAMARDRGFALVTRDDDFQRRDDLPPRGEPNEPNPNWSGDDRPEDIFGKL